jgi:hypothetical protein
MSFLRIGLAALQMTAAAAIARLPDWVLPIPVRALEPSIPSRNARRHHAQRCTTRPAWAPHEYQT